MQIKDAGADTDVGVRAGRSGESEEKELSSGGVDAMSYVRDVLWLA